MIKLKSEPNFKLPPKEEMSEEAMENKLKYFYRTKTDLEINYDYSEKESFEAKYNLTDTKLGNGSYGDVFEVIKKDTNEVLVVKKFKVNDVYNREMSLEYFLGMLEVLRKVSNEYVVRIADRLYLFDSHLYMVMEKIGTYNLYEFKRHYNTSCMSYRTGKYLFEQMVLVTKYLNDNGLIHRDMKTKNFVVKSFTHFEDHKHNVAAYLNKNNCLDAKIYIKLVDFDFLDYFKIAKHHTYIGTRPYVSPQNYNKDLYTEKADIFSTGMVYYFLLTGNYPLDKDDLNAEYGDKIKFEKKLRKELNKKIIEPWTKSILYCLMRYDEIDRCDLAKLLQNKSFNLDSHVLTADADGDL